MSISCLGLVSHILWLSGIKQQYHISEKKKGATEAAP
jgi:hypothetical protein